MRIPPARSLLAAMFALTLLATACAEDDPEVADTDVAEQSVDETATTTAGTTETETETETETGTEAQAGTQTEAEAETDGTTTTTAAEAAAEGTVLDVLEEQGNFTTLWAAIEAAGLQDSLAERDSVTLFAPTDEAFAAMPAGTVDALLADPAALEQVLLFHALPVAQNIETVAAFSNLVTLQGGRIESSTEGDTVAVGGVPITEADLEAGNGFVHVIGGVLTPPPAEG